MIPKVAKHRTHLVVLQGRVTQWYHYLYLG
jgi:hypothetical protein